MRRRSLVRKLALYHTYPGGMPAAGAGGAGAPAPAPAPVAPAAPVPTVAPGTEVPGVQTFPVSHAPAAQTPPAGQQPAAPAAQLPADFVNYMRNNLQTDVTQLSAAEVALAQKMYATHRARVSEVNQEAQTWRQKAQAGENQATRQLLTEIFGNDQVSDEQKNGLKTLVQQSHNMTQTLDYLAQAGIIEPRIAGFIRSANPQATAEALALLQQAGFHPTQLFQQQPQQSNPFLQLLGGMPQMQQAPQASPFTQMFAPGQPAGPTIEQFAALVAQNLAGTAGLGADLGAPQGGGGGSLLPPGTSLREMYGQKIRGNPSTTAMFGPRQSDAPQQANGQPTNPAQQAAQAVQHYRR